MILRLSQVVNAEKYASAAIKMPTACYMIRLITGRNMWQVMNKNCIPSVSSAECFMWQGKFHKNIVLENRSQLITWN
jgi:hypothetical protein